MLRFWAPKWVQIGAEVDQEAAQKWDPKLINKTYQNGTPKLCKNGPKTESILGSRFSGRSWGHLGPLWRLPGPSGCPSWPLPAPSWGCLGAILGHLGTTFGLAFLPHFGAHLAFACPTSGPSWPLLGLLAPILPRPVANLRLSSHMCWPISCLGRAFFWTPWSPASSAQLSGGGDVAPGAFYNSPPPSGVQSVSDQKTNSQFSIYNLTLQEPRPVC